jgi:hypothetical protein
MERQPVVITRCREPHESRDGQGRDVLPEPDGEGLSASQLHTGRRRGDFRGRGHGGARQQLWIHLLWLAGPLLNQPGGTPRDGDVVIAQ